MRPHRLAALFALALITMTGTAVAEPLVDARPDGDARAEYVAVTGNGNATVDRACPPWLDDVLCIPGVAVTGHGDARGQTLALTGHGNATGRVLAVTGTGNADATRRTCVPFADCSRGVSASGTGHATGGAAVSGTGNATGWHGVSGTGDAAGAAHCRSFVLVRECVPLVAVSGTGRAVGDGLLVVSGANRCNDVRCVAVEPDGDARGWLIAVTPNGDAVAFLGVSGSRGVSMGDTGPVHPDAALVVVRVTDDARAALVAVSATGNASTHAACPPWLPSACGYEGAAASGTGNASGRTLGATGTGTASGEVAAALAGNAHACRWWYACAAASGTGDGTGALVASGTGTAHADYVGASGTGNASGCTRVYYCGAASGTGDASGANAVSVTGDAHASECWSVASACVHGVAVSGTGEAHGGRSVSGCALARDAGAPACPRE